MLVLWVVCLGLSLTHLDLSSFDISKVESMHYMFMNCFSLISLNLSSFNTSQVKLFGTMLYNCRKLEYIICLAMFLKMLLYV